MSLFCINIYGNSPLMHEIVDQLIDIKLHGDLNGNLSNQNVTKRRK
jgi:hypothetical protein